MSLKCGIVGLPNVGKSTLFNCLSNAKAQAANYAFCTKEPNVGTVNVPDGRLGKLEELVNPQRVVPATVEIVDIAGLVKGASKGDGLGNQFLANIRETDAILHVIRCFDNDNITHVDGSVDPIRDKEVIDYELIMKDLETLGKKYDKAQKISRTGNKEIRKSLEVMDVYKKHLEAGLPARSAPVEEKDREHVADLFLITEKPVMYICNVDEGSVLKGNPYVDRVKEVVAEENAQVLVIGAAVEADIAELDTYEDRQLFLEELGLEEPGVNKLIRSAYELLDLQTYFTAGEKEVRAWTINRGAKAPEAAGVIHTDFESKFIRAEVIGYEVFVELGSELAVKEAGKMSVEGKEYIVQDGDVMHFRTSA